MLKLVRDEAFQRDLARWRAEAEPGNRLSVVNEILDTISEDLSTSIVDNRPRIARMAELLELGDDAPRRSEQARNNGSHT